MDKNADSTNTNKGNRDLGDKPASFWGCLEQISHAVAKDVSWFETGLDTGTWSEKQPSAFPYPPELLRALEADKEILAGGGRRIRCAYLPVKGARGQRYIYTEVSSKISGIPTGRPGSLARKTKVLVLVEIITWPAEGDERPLVLGAGRTP